MTYFPKFATGNGVNGLKSYVLQGLSDSNAASTELSLLLPGQTDPWLLLTKDDDPIAYFNLNPPIDFEGLQGPFIIQADISGRHYREDDAVVKILRSIQKKLGGQIRDDDDNML